MVEIALPVAEQVRADHDTLTADLSDGRTISVPLSWYPRLAHAAIAERAQWRLIGKGNGIRWDALDEDVGVENLLAGRPSGESQASFKRWVTARAAGK